MSKTSCRDFAFFVGRIALMKKIKILHALFACLVALVLPSVVTAAPVLNGNSTQGGLLWGTVEPGTQVFLGGEAVDVHETGVFVIGFGRDHGASAELEFRRPNGKTETQPIAVTPREFNIERVNGLPPKTVTPPPEWKARRATETGRVRAARAVMTPEILWTHGFVKPAEGRFSGFYGSQRILNGEPRSPHYGLDIAADVGTPIYAPAGGVVRLAAADFLLEGGIVIIDHGLGVTSTLFHMNSVTVKEGARVARGDPIGTVGAKGRANGPHVDWRVNWKNVRLDPLLVLEKE